jgi:hypothetical protein
MRGTARTFGAALAAVVALTQATAAQANGSALKGYEVVTSQGVTGYQGWYTRGEATCPRGKVPLAGGVLFESWDLGLTAMDSIPSSDGWVVDVRNGLSGVPFDVYAVCAKRPKDYQVVTSAWYGYEGYSQSNGYVACPSGTKALGGGVQTVSTSSDVYIGQSSPSATGGTWGATVANESWSDVFQVTAVCGHVTRDYLVANASPATVPAGTLRQIFVQCPTGTVPLGGGATFGWSEPDFGTQTTIPLATGWSTLLSNRSDMDLVVGASVACE